MTLANVTIGTDLPVFEASSAMTADANVGVVVVQEWWGLNAWMQSITRQLAEAVPGARALCPDLYRGQVAQSEREAGHLMGHLDWPRALQDIQACIDYLRANRCTRVAVLGFCMGSALSIAAGVRCHRLDGIVCFYGIPSPDIADPSKLSTSPKCQFHFGQLDECAGFSDPKSADHLENTLRSHRCNFEFFRYPKCCHAFMNQLRPNFDADAFALALERVRQFLCKL